LYYFGLIAGEWPPAGAYFPLLDQGTAILGDTFRRGTKPLIEGLLSTSHIYSTACLYIVK